MSENPVAKQTGETKVNVNFYFQIILKKIVSKDAACETNSEMNFTISKGKQLFETTNLVKPEWGEGRSAMLGHQRLNFVVLNYNGDKFQKFQEFVFRVNQSVAKENQENENGEYLIDCNNFIEHFLSSGKGTFSLLMKVGGFEVDAELFVERKRLELERIVKEAHNSKDGSKVELIKIQERSEEVKEKLRKAGHQNRFKRSASPTRRDVKEVMSRKKSTQRGQSPNQRRRLITPEKKRKKQEVVQEKQVQEKKEEIQDKKEISEEKTELIEVKKETVQEQKQIIQEKKEVVSEKEPAEQNKEEKIKQQEEVQEKKENPEGTVVSAAEKEKQTSEIQITSIEKKQQATAAETVKEKEIKQKIKIQKQKTEEEIQYFPQLQVQQKTPLQVKQEIPLQMQLETPIQEQRPNRQNSLKRQQSNPEEPQQEKKTVSQQNFKSAEPFKFGPKAIIITFVILVFMIFNNWCCQSQTPEEKMSVQKPKPQKASKKPVKSSKAKKSKK